MPAFGQLRVYVQQEILLAPRTLGLRVLIKFENDPSTFGQPFYSFNEFHVLVFLNKLKDISTRMTPKAVIDLSLRIDVEARTILLMKRT